MNILLVDDDRVSRVSLQEFLCDLGHQVTESENGQDALEKLQKNRFHLVLSDICMPKMTGLELLREIKQQARYKEIDVVLFTGYGDVNSAVTALRLGAYDYIFKPINVEELVSLIDRVAERRALYLENKVLKDHFEAEVEAATNEAKREISRLKHFAAQSIGLEEIVAYSPHMEHVVEIAARYHEERNIPVLIQGDTGTGKEIIAKIIHYGTMKDVSPFVAINCAAITPTLFDSELFGYERNSFTGAASGGQKGKLDLAMGGTLFLDEVGEIPLQLQGKLLRVLQEKEYYRVGGLRKIHTDVRIISATNVPLEEKVEAGLFRRDLYYRLRVGYIKLLPLKERPEDITPLAKLFLSQYAAKKGAYFNKISKEAEDILVSYSWPGNVRELKNVMEWAVFMHNGPDLLPEHLSFITGKQRTAKSFCPRIRREEKALDWQHFCLPSGEFPLENFVEEVVLKALAMHKGNKSATANYLGISRRSLYCRLEKMTDKLSVRKGP